MVMQKVVSQELQTQGDPSAGLLNLPQLVAEHSLHR